MGKIIKNNVVYGGVPDEVITAWETEEVQDLSEPVMGEADISGIGDGSITGAIAEHGSDISELNSNTIKDIHRETVTVQNINLTANGTYTNDSLDITSAIPSGYTAVFVYCRATGSNVVYCYNSGLLSNGTKAVLQLRNNTSSAITVNAILDVISIKK